MQKITKMSELVSASRPAIIKSTKVALEAGRKSYVEVGKSCIAIKQSLKKGETLYGVLSKAGIKNSQIANGQQFAKVWEEWVATDKMTEAKFDSTMNFTLAVSLNKLTRDDPEKATAYLNNPEEWESLAKHGKTVEAQAKTEADKVVEDTKQAAKLEEAKIADKARKLNESSQPADEVEATETETEEVEVEATETETEEVEVEETETEEAETPTAPVTKADIKKSHLSKLTALLDELKVIAIEIAGTGDEAEIVSAQEKLSEDWVVVNTVLASVEFESEEAQVANG
jgi:hypothetical protein